MEGMTTLSRAQFESAARITTPAEAAALLLCYPHYRTLGDVLHSLSGDPRIKELLVTGFLRWYPESRTDALDRKARNWLSCRCQNLTKEDAFILSHILELPLDKTDALLKMTAGEGIHWRDPEDILWSYAIVHHLEPARTRALLEQAKRSSRPRNPPPPPPPRSTQRRFSISSKLFCTAQRRSFFPSFLPGGRCSVPSIIQPTTSSPSIWSCWSRAFPTAMWRLTSKR